MAGFSHTWVLLFLVLIPIGYFLYIQAKNKKKQSAMKFSHLGFVKSALGDKKQSKIYDVLFYLSILSILCLIIGLADPHIPLEQSKEGVNVVLVLDDSGSMRAEDYSPNRLEAAKRSAKVLLESLDEKDHAGIVTFNTGATTAAYLSPFKDQVIDKLMAVKVKDGSTAIGDGLSLGIDMATSIPNKKKVVILLSDGVSNSGVITPGEAVSFAKSKDIKVHTIALGSTEPVVLGHDFFGRPVMAELDEATLQAIAEQTGGNYFKSVDDETLENIYETIGENIEREKEETSIKNWFIVLSLALMITQFILRYGRKRVIQ